MSLQQLMSGMGGMGMGGQASQNQFLPDTSEQVYVSSLAMIKMLKHGRAGVPMEVMGLMLGEFVDDYTIKVVDVFSMPQSGNTVSVESVDEVYQKTMMDLMQQVGRPESVVGWYHSHPGWGCWLSSTDINTQQSFEMLDPRCVALVVDPVQSVKGKVVMDCFRLISPQQQMLGQEPRQTTSNIGHLNKPNITALIHGLNRHYYSLPINTRKSQLEQQMLLSLGRNKWQDGLRVQTFEDQNEKTAELLRSMKTFSKGYIKLLEDELTLTEEEIVVKNVGKTDPKKGLENDVEQLMTQNILQTMGVMMDTIVF